MKFWQHILYPKEGRKQLVHEIEYERNDKDLKYNIAEANRKEEGVRKKSCVREYFRLFFFWQVWLY